MSSISCSPPKASGVQYEAPLGTRWEKEKAAAGGAAAFDLPTDPRSIGPWIIGECVGKGASGRVKIAKHRHTGQLAAVKILPLAPLVNSRASLNTQLKKSEKQRLGVDREITMMKLMNHPNVLRIYDVYEGTKELFLVLEYVEGGELFDFLVNRGRLPPIEALAYFKQIIHGLNYAHTFSIIHRDLKPENILIASLNPPLIKIADWGMAAFAPPSLELETSCGSPHYASPEIVNGERYQGTATDIWSCGVILYALLTGRLPFDDKNVRVLLDKVKNGKYTMPPWVDPQAADLIGKMLVIDVTRRITIPDILKHPWFISTAELPATALDPVLARALETPPMPPSPSTLGRPLPDPSQIDPDLLHSLKIIWGKHTDVEGQSIKDDLCSPAGSGVHAKAFYFLLRKYRDENSRFAPVELPKDPDAAPKSPPPRSLTFNLGWELDTNLGQHAITKYDESELRKVEIDVAKPSTKSTTQIIVPPRLSRTLSRDRPLSPGGPRLPYIAGTSKINSSIPQSTLHVTPFVQAGPSVRPMPKRGHTYSHPQNFSQNKTASTRRFSPNAKSLPLPQLGPKTEVNVRRPVSVSYLDRSVHYGERGTNHQAVHSIVPETAPPPVATTDAPKAVISETETILEGSADKVNDYLIGIPLTRQRSVHIAPRRCTSNGEDKENISFSDESWTYVGDTSVQASEVREVGKDMKNMVPLQSQNSKRGKEKKNKPPPIDVRSLSQKWPVFGAPLPTAPANVGTAQSSRLLASPVVGEFKGCFSNLFGWKHHAQGTGLLYSADDIYVTRNEVGRFLQGLGVFVQGLGFGQPLVNYEECVLHCQVDEGNPLSTQHLTGKAVTFRVELKAPPVGTSLSPNENLFPARDYLSSRRVNSFAMSRSPTNSPLLSPNPNGFPEFPPGCLTAIIVVYEKGSMSGFKAIWKHLKGAYGEIGHSYTCHSPLVDHTPATEHPQRFAI